ncbi:hypothetical protein LguiB_013151 [Lonicera macranthoides]
MIDHGPPEQFQKALDWVFSYIAAAKWLLIAANWLLLEFSYIDAEMEEIRYELPSSNVTIGATDVSGEKKKRKVTFNLQGQIIQGKNEFKARGLELVKSHVGLAFDDWIHVPDAKKQDMFDILLKRKPNRVELYVDARKHPKTNLCHPGAISDVGLDPSFPRESGGSHCRPSGEAGGIPTTLHGSEKSATGSPSTPTFGPSKYYKLMNLDGSKVIA